MAEWAAIILCVLAGVLLGCVYFGGLWMTVRFALEKSNFSTWMFASFIFRTAIVLLGFYGLTFGGWLRVVFALAGFLAIKKVIVGSVLARVSMENSRGNVS